MIRNYFSDLELEITADAESVKKAYRRLARRFHPDLNPGDLYAEQSFKRIQEAFQNLRTEAQIRALRNVLEKRSMALSISSRWQRDSSGFHYVDETIEAESTRQKERRAEELDIRILVGLSPKEQKRKTKEIELEIQEACPSCRGMGGGSHSVQHTCKLCAGMGYQLIRRGAFRWKKTCENCHGMGYEVAEACQQCLGYGKIQVKKRIQLALPSTIDPRLPVQYKGQGHGSFNGLNRGDLWVIWKQKN